MQNIKTVFIIVIVFVEFPVFFFLGFYFSYCLIMAAAYPTLCCYSLNGFDGCIPGCVTLATHLYMYLSVALCGFEYIHTYLKRQRFPYFLARIKVTYPYK